MKKFNQYVKEDFDIILEFNKVAMNAAKDAIAKKMSHKQAKDHVYDTVLKHASKSPYANQGAGGAVSRIRINQALDKADDHLDKHYG